MRGLIYKDVNLFFKSADKKTFLIVGGMMVLLMINAGELAGLMSSMMVSMVVGIQHIMCYSSDEKARWNKYQLAMPVKGSQVVGSKYISVAITVCLSLIASIILCTVSSIIFGSFNGTLWYISIAAAILFPIIIPAVCLPLAYWFGFSSAQILGMVSILPMMRLISFFENGKGITAAASWGYIYLLWAVSVAIGIFALSYAISLGGYVRKGCR